MRFLKQEYWSGLSFLSSENFSHPGSSSDLLKSSALFPTPDAADRPAKGKVECVCFLLTSHLQGNSQDFHSPADPHSPPHHSTWNRKGNFARTNATPAALRFGVNRVGDTSVKGGSCSRVRRCGHPNPATTHSSPFQSLSPFWLILCSLLMFAFLGSFRQPHTFVSCPTMTAASLSPL